MSVTRIRIFTAALAAIGLSTAPAAADSWTVDHDESRLGVVATQMGSEFTAAFESFRADIEFDPDALDDAHVRVVIDVASFTSDSRDRDGNVTNSEWFAAGNHPEAVFETTAFRETDQGYEADATLRIKGVSRDVTLPFTLEIDDDRAHMQGELDLVRTAFNVGEGQWESGDTVGLDVTVTVDLVASRAD
ncbi:YceI family protein [Fodinicurvata sp. EGI_FJ10296]|uniref:YceI family protein n=1 Tax=Fodinicurvata sp. EGI_FJ10296 TaxID=3231908 RepID=UPI0034542C08